jgi:TatD DNase family protein
MTESPPTHRRPPADDRGLVDAHCHLQDAAFDADRGAVIERARQSGIHRFFCCGTSPDDWGRVRELANRQRDVIPFYGLHPWFLDRAVDGWEERLAEFAADPRAGAGEAGLDRRRNGRDNERERRVFQRQLERSIDARKPLAVHCVGAWGEMHELLREAGPHPAGLLFHAYSGSVDLMEPLAALGGVFSFGGSLLNPRHRTMREALRAAPPDRWTLETDAPDMLPRGVETSAPGRNEPVILVRILSEAASLRGIDEDQAARESGANARSLCSFAG